MFTSQRIYRITVVFRKAFAYLRGSSNYHYICLNASLVAGEGGAEDVVDTIMLV